MEYGEQVRLVFDVEQDVIVFARYGFAVEHRDAAPVGLVDDPGGVDFVEPPRVPLDAFERVLVAVTQEGVGVSAADAVPAVRGAAGRREDMPFGR